MFIHGSLIISFKLPLSLKSRGLSVSSSSFHILMTGNMGCQSAPSVSCYRSPQKSCPTKAGFPVTTEYKTTLRLHTSTAGPSCCWPRWSSGAAYRGRGATTISVQHTALQLIAEAKFCNFYIHFGITKQVLCFRSLWMIPFSWHYCPAESSC